MNLSPHYSCRFFGMLLGCLLLVASIGCQPEPDDQPDVWRFAIEESVGSVQYQYALEFEKQIEQQTDHQVDVVIYPYGTLGTSTQITEQLNLGIVQLAMASPGSLGKFIPELQVFLLHFVLPTRERDIDNLLKDPELLASLDPLYQAKGLKLLAMYSEGPMAWTLNQEVRSPDDFRGVKMRVMTSPILLAAYGAYGASPTPMPYAEVYSGLQLKMIDGQVNPLFAIERQKFHEVTSWLVLPGHTSFVTSAAANLDFYQSLSDQRRQIVDKTIADLQESIFVEQSRRHWDSFKQIVRDKIRRKEVLHVLGDLSTLRERLSDQERRELLDENPYIEIHPSLTSEEIQVFRDASQSAVDVFLEVGGADSQETLDSLQQPGSE